MISDLLGDYQTIRISYVTNLVLFLSFRHLLFEFVSYFDIRISATLHSQIMPSGLRPRPGPLDPDFYYAVKTFRHRYLCQEAKYQVSLDIIRFQGLGVKVSNTIPENYGVAGAIA